MTGSYRPLQVPTKAVEAEVLCADGRIFRGRVFMPDVAATHSGPMRPAEWMNEPAPFFPFRPEDGSGSVLLNRSESAARAEVTWDLVGGTRSDTALVRDLWERQERRVEKPDQEQPRAAPREGEMLRPADEVLHRPEV